MTKSDAFYKHPLHATWDNQVRRTTSTCNRDFKTNYGSRSIDMYKPWPTNFKLWLSYIELLLNYEKCIKISFNYTINRVNNNISYQPMNLRIVEISTQAFNRRIQSNNTSVITGISQRKNKPGCYYELKLKVNDLKKEVLVLWKKL